jgi:hypothetical protein
MDGKHHKCGCVGGHTHARARARKENVSLLKNTAPPTTNFWLLVMIINTRGVNITAMFTEDLNAYLQAATYQKLKNIRTFWDLTEV